MSWKDLARLAAGVAERVATYRPEDDAPPPGAAPERRSRQDDPRSTAPAAELRVDVSGGETGTLVVSLPCEREEDASDEELAWLRVRLEAPYPVPLGSTTLATFAVAVPAYAGPGRYDLTELHRRGEAGEIGWWEPFDLHLSPVPDVDDRTWYVDLSAAAPAVVDVTAAGLSFDLPMASAVNAVRVTGSIAW